MSQILRELLRVSEKAAHIARACRQQEALFQLLIEEKKEGEKNKKFAVDFKTLADVLVQEVIKHNMGNKVREGPARWWAEGICLWGFLPSRNSRTLTPCRLGFKPTPWGVTPFS